jgi:hypothetical protein
MVDRDTLLSSYRRSIMRFQKLLKTHLTEEDHDYIKERISACRAAVKALIRRLWDRASTASNSSII